MNRLNDHWCALGNSDTLASDGATLCAVNHCFTSPHFRGDTRHFQRENFKERLKFTRATLIKG